MQNRKADARPRAARRPPFRRRPLFEALEPRVLLSADLNPNADHAAPEAQLVQEASQPQHVDLAAVLSQHERASRSLVFLDSSLGEYQAQLGDADVVLLDAGRDGVAQITEALAGRSDLDAVHIVTHGDANGAALGSATLGGSTIDSYAQQLATWSQALSEDADILLYGCNVGADAGFVTELGRLTGADIAASDDLTGAAALGGDWVLEARSGAIDAAALVLDYGGLLKSRVDANAPQTTREFDAAGATGTAAGELFAPNQAVQAQFGRHDVGAVRAHVGGGPGQSTAQMGAYAYATGDQISFRPGDAVDSLVFAGENVHVDQNISFDIRSESASQSPGITAQINGIHTVTANNMEVLVGGAASNTYTFHSGFSSLEIFNPSATSARLDFSNVSNDLLIRRAADADGSGNRLAIDGDSGAQGVVARDVTRIDGGSGDDMYQMFQAHDAGARMSLMSFGPQALNDEDELELVLAGGDGDDQYVFYAAPAGDLEVVELEDGGNDVADFSNVGDDLTVEVANGGFSVTEAGAPELALNLEHVETLRAGTGTNTYVVRGLLGSLVIDNHAAEGATLDFRQYQGADLVFEIGPPEAGMPGAVNKIMVSDGLGNFLVVHNVWNIFGGPVVNRYAFVNGGLLPGTITGNTDAIGQAEADRLDYTRYGASATVSFSSSEPIRDAGVPLQVVQAGATGTQEQWSLVVGAAGGTFSLALGERDTGPLSFNIDDTGLELELEIKFNRDFGVSGQGTEASPFLITFERPGAVADALLLDRSQLMVGSTTAQLAQTRAGAEAVPEIQRLSLAGVAGEFALEFFGQSSEVLDVASPALRDDLQREIATRLGFAGAQVVADGADAFLVTFAGAPAAPLSLVKLRQPSSILEARAELRTDTVGVAGAHEVREVWSDAVGGTFTISYAGDTTDPIDWNSGAEALRLKLEDAFDRRFIVSGEGTAARPWRIMFYEDGPISGKFTLDASKLGGSAQVTTTTAGTLQVNEVQRLNIEGGPSGRFRLQFQDRETHTLDLLSPSFLAELETEIRERLGFANVRIEPGEDADYLLTFLDPIGTNPAGAPIALGVNKLSGSAEISVAVQTAAVAAKPAVLTLAHDGMGGSFKLVLVTPDGRRPTADIPWDASADVIRDRLNAGNVGANVTVTQGANSHTWVITGNQPGPLTIQPDWSNLEPATAEVAQGRESWRVASTATGGKFVLARGSVKSIELDWNTSTADLQTILRGVFGAGTSVTGEGTAAAPWLIGFAAASAAPLTLDASSTLTGGTLQFAKSDAAVGLAPVQEVRRLWTDATGGSFTLTRAAEAGHPAQTTAPISYAESRGQIEAKISAAFGRSVDVTGEGSAQSPWILTFREPGPLGVITVDSSGLLMPGGRVSVNRVSDVAQDVTVDARAGTFRLGMRGEFTAPIAVDLNDTAAQVKQKLEQALNGVGQIVDPDTGVASAVTVTVAAADPWRAPFRVTFVNPSATLSPLLVDASGLMTRTVTLAAMSAANVNGGAANGFSHIHKVSGSERRDYLVLGDAGAAVSGGGGADVIFGGAAVDTILGGEGNDELLGGGGKDQLTGQAGDDLIRGGADDDSIDGSSGRDRLFGGTGDDRILGGAGDDWIEGDFGRDTLIGGDGNDTLIGGAGGDVPQPLGLPLGDTLEGGGGEDRYVFTDGWGHDIVKEGREGSGVSGFLRRTGAGQTLLGAPGDDVLDFSGVKHGMVHVISEGGIDSGASARFDDLAHFPGTPSVSRDADDVVQARNGAEQSSPGNIERIVTSPEDNSFVFLGSISSKGWKGTLTIDTSATVKAGQPLVLDFRPIQEQLIFTFATDPETGVTSLTVVRPGFRVPLVSEPDPAIIITNVDANTIIYGGVNRNTFLMQADAVYEGKLVGPTGLRPLGTSQALAFAQDWRDLLGLNLPGRAHTIENILAYQPSVLEAAKRAASLENPLNALGRVSHVDTGKGLYPGFTQGNVSGITQVVAGAGLNFLQGKPFLQGQGTGSTAADILSLTGLGGDMFTIGNTAMMAKRDWFLQLADTFTGVSPMLMPQPGLHLLTGGFSLLGSGPDTYRFTTPVWGVAGILEAPDLTVGGFTVPEFQDTLDMSQVRQDLTFTAFEVTTANLDTFTNLFRSYASRSGTTDRFDELAIGTTVLLVTDGLIGELAQLFGDETPQFIQDLKDILGVDLLGNIILATDIENVIGGTGVNTFRFMGGAKIQGTISAGRNAIADLEGSLVFDYSQFRAAGDTQGIRVDAGSGEGTIDNPLAPEHPLRLVFGRADGVLGNRLGGLEQIGDLFDSDIFGGRSLRDFSVSSLDGVIGTPNADFLAGSSQSNSFYGGGGADVVDGKGGEDLFSYANLERDTVISLVEDEAWDQPTGVTLSAPEPLALPLSVPVQVSRTLTFADDATGPAALWIGATPVAVQRGLSADALKSRIETLVPGVTNVAVTGGGQSPFAISFSTSQVARTVLAVTGLGLGTAADPSPERVSLVSIEAIGGGKGNDVLIGDLGDNRFVFEDDWGVDVVIDTGGGSDVLDFSRVGGGVEVRVLAEGVTLVTKGANRLLAIGTELNVLPQGQNLFDKISGRFSRESEKLTDHGAHAIEEGTGVDGGGTGTGGSTGGLTGTVGGEVAVALTDAQLATALAEALARWDAAGTSISAVVGDLPDLMLARIDGGVITVDATAAGAGWFVDPTPQDDTEFAATTGGVLAARAGSGATAGYDLLTTLMHEVGHVLGHDHAAQPSALMNESLAPGVRKAASSDEDLLRSGLEAFAEWARNYSPSLDDIIAGAPHIPFVDAALDGLWSVTGDEIAEALADQIVAQVLGVFGQAGAGPISSEDLLALPNIHATNSSNTREFRTSVQLVEPLSLDVDFSFNLADLVDLGFDLPLELRQSDPLTLTAGVRLDFDFGIDGEQHFYVRDPRFVASLNLGHDEPLDISLSIGPLAAGVQDGTIRLNTEVSFGTQGRLTFEDLNGDPTGDLIGAPVVGSDASWEIDLPIVLEGALAGLQPEPLLLRSSSADGLSIGGTIGEIFSNIAERLEVSGQEALGALQGVSLEQALVAIEDLLDQLAQPDGPAFDKLPVINQSLVDLFGDGTTDVMAQIRDAIAAVNDTLTDEDGSSLQAFERDLNFELAGALQLEVDLGERAEVDAAAAALAALSPSLGGASTDDDLALALAATQAEFRSLLVDRDYAAAAGRLGALGLDATASDVEIAAALATAPDGGALLAALKAARDLAAPQQAFLDALGLLARYGLGASPTDAAILAALDNAADIALVTQLRDQLAGPAASDGSDATSRAIALTVLEAHGLVDAMLVSHSLTSGTFTLSFDGETTAPIDWDAGAEEVQAKLEALTRLGPVAVLAEGASGAAWRISGADLTGTNLALFESATPGVSVAPALPDDTAIASALDRSAVIAAAMAAREVVQATPGEVRAAADRLLAFGIAPDATDEAIVTALADAETLEALKGDRTLLRDAAIDAADVAAAQARLAARGLDAASTDAGIAFAIVDDGQLAARRHDRDVLAQYDAFKPIGIAYEGSKLSLDLNLTKHITTTIDFALDLQQVLDLVPEEVRSILEPLIGEGGVLSADASGGIFIDAFLDLHAGILFDLANLADPEVYIADWSTLDFTLEAHNTAPLDAGIGIDVPGIGTVSVRVEDGSGALFVDAHFSFDEDADGRYALGELAAAVNDSVTVDATLDLPLYFPTDSMPLGGSELDENADGFADNVLHFDYHRTADGASESHTAIPDLAGSFDLFAFLDDPDNLLAGLEGFFDGLDAVADGIDFDLPLIGGDAFDNLAGTVRDVRSAVLGAKDGSGEYQDGLGKWLQDIPEGQGVAGSILDLIRTQIYNGLAPLNSDLFSLVVAVRGADGRLQYDEDGLLVTRVAQSAEDIELDLVDGELLFNIRFAGTLLDGEVPVDFAAGLPGLNLEVDAALDATVKYLMGIGLGLSADRGVFLDTSGINAAGEEIALYIDAGLAPHSSATGTLGFLNMRVSTDDAHGNSLGDTGLRGHFGLDVTDGWGLDVNTSAVAQANLGVTVDVGSGAFPSVSALLEIDWDLLSGDPHVKFDHVTLDLGSFIGSFVKPILDTIGDVLDPIMPLVDVMVMPLPVVTDLINKVGGMGGLPAVDALADGENGISLYDLASAIQGSRPNPQLGFVLAAIDIIRLIERLDEVTDSALIDLGSFELTRAPAAPGQPPKMAMTAQAADPAAQLNQPGAGASSKDFMKSALGTAKQALKFPILSNPIQLFKLLTGDDVDATLFEFDMPALDFDFNLGAAFPIFPPFLTARLNGSFSAFADFDFGFDTFGLRRYSETGDVADIFQGFFLSDHIAADGTDGVELRLSAGVSAGVTLGAGLVEGRVQGGITGVVTADFHDIDPDGALTLFKADGRIRPYELAQLFAYSPLAVFDFAGKITYSLDASVAVGLIVDLGVLGSIRETIYEDSYNLASGTLVDFSFSAFPDQTPPPLAVLDANGDLILATGTGNDAFNVSYEQDQILVAARGFGQAFSASQVRRIVGHGGAGNDSIIIEPSVQVAVLLTGGDGNDTLKAGSGAATLSGGAGDDLLQGGSGADFLDGGEGTDVLRGGAGNDALNGGGGDDTLEGGSENDTLAGGGGNDVLLGEDGNDVLVGDAGTDRLEGGKGADTLHGTLADVSLLGGAGNDFIEALAVESGFVSIDGGEGDDAVRVAYGAATVQGGAGRNTLEIFAPTAAGAALTLNANSFEILGGGTIAFAGFAQGMTLALGEGADVLTVRSTPTTPTTILMGGGGDEVTVKATTGSLVLDLGEGNDKVTLGNGGSLAGLNSALALRGGGGADQVVYDNSADVANHAGAKAISVLATAVTGLPTGSAAQVSFDAAIETLELKLGSGADTVLLPDLFRHVIVNGGGGSDTVNATLLGTPDPAALGKRVVTHAVESVSFVNNDAAAAVTDWVLVDDTLRVGNRVLLETHGASTTQIALSDAAGGTDRVQVQSVLSATAIDLRRGNGAVEVGSALENVVKSLSLASAGGATLTLQDGERVSIEQAGTIGAGLVTGFGMGDRIAFSGFGSLALNALDNSGYRVTITDTALPTHLTLGTGADTITVTDVHAATTLTLGGGADNVTVLAAASPLTVQGDAGDTLTFSAATRTTPVSAEVRAGQLSVTGIAPSIAFDGIGTLGLQLGASQDSVLIDNASTLLAVNVHGGGGNDKVEVTRAAGMTFVDGGLGEDLLTVEIAGDPGALAQGDLANKLSFAIEKVVVDNQANIHATPYEWRMGDGMLSLGATSLLRIDGADEVRVLAGIGSDTLQIREETAGVDAVINGDRVDVVRGSVVLQQADLNDALNAQSAFQGLTAPQNVAVAPGANPDESYLYVRDATGALSVLKDGANGLEVVQLIDAATAGGGSASSINDVALSPNRQFLYTSTSAEGRIVAFARNPADGKLSLVGVGATGLTGVSSLAVSADGYLYAAGNNQIAIFAIGPQGGLTFSVAVTSPAVPLAGVNRVQISADGERLYAMADNGRTSVFERASSGGGLFFDYAFGPGGLQTRAQLLGATGGEPNDTAMLATDLNQDLRNSFVGIDGSGRQQFTIPGWLGGIAAGGDVDFYKVDLAPGGQISATLNRDGIATLDPFLYLLDRNGNVLASNDDIGGGNTNASLTFSNFAYAGDYYLVAAGDGGTTGGYRLTVTTASFESTTEAQGQVFLRSTAPGVFSGRLAGSLQDQVGGLAAIPMQNFSRSADPRPTRENVDLQGGQANNIGDGQVGGPLTQEQHDNLFNEAYWINRNVPNLEHLALVGVDPNNPAIATLSATFSDTVFNAGQGFILQNVHVKGGIALELRVFNDNEVVHYQPRIVPFNGQYFDFLVFNVEGGIVGDRVELRLLAASPQAYFFVGEMTVLAQPLAADSDSHAISLEAGDTVALSVDAGFLRLVDPNGNTVSSGSTLNTTVAASGQYSVVVQDFSSGQPAAPYTLNATWDPLESTCRHASLSIL